MAQTQCPALEDVIELEPDVVGVFETLADRMGIKGAAAATGLTYYQMAGTYAPSALARGDMHRVKAYAYRKACEALGIEPDDKTVYTRPHRATKAEQRKNHTKLTTKIRDEIRRFIRGRRIQDAAEELGTTPYILQSLYRSPPKGGVPKPRACIPTLLLHQIRDVLKNGAAIDIPGADEHTKFSRAGYRRIEASEQVLIKNFLMGGSIREAADFLGEFGRKYAVSDVCHWISSGNKSRFINDFDYMLMSAIVSIRDSAGYYAITTDSYNFKTVPLHVDNTPSRRAVIEQYADSFSSSKSKYRLAAGALGTSVRNLKHAVNGEHQNIPAWLYIRVLEQGEQLGIPEEDGAIRRHIGHSHDLEHLLNDYSLESLRQTFVPQLKAAMQYLAEPQQSIYAFLRALSQPDSDYPKLMDKLAKYTEVLARNRGLIIENGVLWAPTPQSDFVEFLGLKTKGSK